MDYIHEDRDLLMGLQDDLSDMLYATGKFSIDLNEIVNEYMPHIPLYLIENEDEIKEVYSDRIDDDDNLYEILTDYVTDTVGSYTALQEFIHDRHANDWIEN